jgi:anaerobic selenocysteine-containing dehydrogenase
MFHVSTRRGKQFNTMVYAETDPLTGATRDAVLMSADDAASLRVRQGDRIRLVNGHGSYEGRVHVAALASGNLQVHWPEGNVLLSRDRRDLASFCPDYNATVRVEPL